MNRRIGQKGTKNILPHILNVTIVHWDGDTRNEHYIRQRGIQEEEEGKDVRMNARNARRLFFTGA